MDSPPLPASLADDDLAKWLHAIYISTLSEYGSAHEVGPEDIAQARAVRALVEAKVREAIDADRDEARVNPKVDGWIIYDATPDEIVSHVLGAP